MRSLALSTLITLSAIPAAAQPAIRLDKGQAEAASRLIDVGDTVRIYCKPCADVVYSTVGVRSRELRPWRELFELQLNGETVDVSMIYVDDGYGDGWENLALLLGTMVEGPAPALPPALDDAVSLVPHAGSYTGKIGDAAARLDLVLTGRKLDGTYVRLDDGTSFKVLATAYNLNSRGESLTLIERGDADRVTATLQGELDGASATFRGVRKPLGGSEAEPFELTRARD